MHFRKAASSEILQEGLGRIDVLLTGAQDIYCSNYKKADTPLRGAQGNNIFRYVSRYIIEGFCNDWNYFLCI